MKWEDVVRELEELGNYDSIFINSRNIYKMLLKNRGFVKHEPLKEENKQLKGSGFCRALERMYPDGNKRIVARSGERHLVAVMPFEEEGKIRYKFVDTWNSTKRRVKKYYVKEENE